jgi:hypothetical protein
MRREAGQIIVILAWIGFFIALIFLVSCFAVAHHGHHSNSMQQISDHRYCDGRDSCDDQDQDHYQHRGNFSPGPFDRSPVDVHDNNICISPDCSQRSPTTTTTR